MKDFDVRFGALNSAIVPAGHPPGAPWWRETLCDFYASGCRQLVIRAGRRAGKSSTLCRVAVLEALYGSHEVPAGDIGFVAFVSVSRDEAAQRLRTIRAILDVLRVKYQPIEGGIELVGRRRGFKTFAATVSGVSGFTCISAICDEVAKWKDADSGANPATEVLASLGPTMATMRTARRFLSSSPVSTVDAHAKAFANGNTEFQRTAFAESWRANPSLTEEQCRRDEPDERVFLREYAAIPSGELGSVFTAEEIDRALVDDLSGFEITDAPMLMTDPAGFGEDAWTWAVAAWARPRVIEEKYASMALLLDGRRVVPDYVDIDSLGSEAGHVIHAGDVPDGAVWSDPRSGLVRTKAGDVIENPRFGLEGRSVLALYAFGRYTGAERRKTTSSAIVATIVREARRHGCARVASDQLAAYQLSAAFAEHGIGMIPHNWDMKSKPLAVSRLKTLARDGRLKIHAGALRKEMRDELLGFSERHLPSGYTAYEARKGRRDDLVALITLALAVDAMGGLRGGELRTGKRKFDWRVGDIESEELW